MKTQRRLTYFFFLWVFFFLPFSFVNASGLEIETGWTVENTKYLDAYCSEGNQSCHYICNDESHCRVSESVCRNCIGSSIEMTFLFEEMGRSITSNLAATVDVYTLSDLISSHRFFTLTSRSIYNHVDSFDSFRLRRRFQSLCPDRTRYPVVFLERLSSNRMGQPLYVWCESGVFHLELHQNVDISQDFQ